MSPPPRRVGARLIPGYVNLGHLRRGEDTDVHDAWSIERDCRCVVKMLVPGTRAAGPRERLLAEGNHLVRLVHPNLVRVYAVSERPAAVVLETLTGATLGHLIASEGRSPLDELGALAIQLASVLGYLHRNRLLHLDVKPSNLVCQDAQVRLLDLGIAAAPGATHGYGTPAYMAPEQHRGGQIDTWSDVWALGMTLYEAAAGEHPTGGEAIPAGTAVASIRTRRRLPRDIAATIDACLDLQPAGRPTLAEIRTRFSALLPPDDRPPTL